MDSFIFLVILLVLIGTPIAYSTNLSFRVAEKRNVRLRAALGDSVRILESFPIPAEVERIIQAALARTLDSFRYIVMDANWIFVQPTNRNGIAFTKTEDRGPILFSIFTITLDCELPNILVQHRSRNNFLMSWQQVRIENGEYILCEGVFEKTQRIYARTGSQIDTLSILSPEVLEQLQDPPLDADIFVRKNQLYYTFRSSKHAYDIVPLLQAHANNLVPELESNGRRWAATNRDAWRQIHDEPLAEILAETYQR